jgi:hypothetical protein
MNYLATTEILLVERSRLRRILDKAARLKAKGVLHDELIIESAKIRVREINNALAQPVDVSEIDPLTLEYLELVSGKRGQSALNAWTKFTGFDEDERQIPLRERVLNAYRTAHDGVATNRNDPVMRNFR